MDPPAHVASTIVDDSEVFYRCVRPIYTTFKSFEDDFRLFQKCTLTCFYVYTSVSGSNWLRTHPRAFPKSFPYYRVKFCCVHNRRKHQSARIYRNIHCPAFVMVRVVGKCYKIVNCCLQHNHDMHLYSIKSYARNRRLTPEQESEVVELMSTLHDFHQICYYIRDKFNCVFTMKDVYALRARYKLRDQRTDAKVDSNGPPLTGGQSVDYANVTVDHTTVVPSKTVSSLENMTKPATTVGDMGGNTNNHSINRLKNVVELMSSGKDCELYCLDKRTNALFDVSNGAAVRRFLGKDSRTVGRPLETMAPKKPIPSTSSAPLSKTSAKRKAPVTIRITDDADVEMIKDSAQLVGLRQLRTTTEAPCEITSEQLEVGNSHFMADICSICGLEEPLVNFEEEDDNQLTPLVHCLQCQCWAHWKCANYVDDEHYMCIHCSTSYDKLN